MSIKLLFIIFFILFVVLIAWFFFWNKASIFGPIKANDNQTALPRRVIKINDTELNVEIANTPFRRSKGLSGRKSIPENSGMLFVFKKPDFHSFWMINMKFSIDIIWINESQKITGIEKNIAPKSFPKTFSSHYPAKYVLEVNAGWSDKYNIKQGDVFNFEDKD